MGKITFIGDGSGESPAVCEMFGMSFPLNEPVEVENEAHFAKLAGNPEFSAEGVVATRETVEDDIARVLEAERSEQAEVQEVPTEPTEPEAPVKRRRGRPRKNPHPDED
jgi:hypothetical protein